MMIAKYQSSGIAHLYLGGEETVCGKKLTIRWSIQVIPDLDKPIEKNVTCSMCLDCLPKKGNR